MPHLHDEKSSDNDDTSRASEGSKSLHSGEDLTARKAAESAASKLLSLAALAEVHGKANAEDPAKEDSGKNSASPEAKPNSLSPSLAMRRPSYEDGRPPMAPWGMAGHYPSTAHYPPGYYRPPPMHHPMYGSPGSTGEAVSVGRSPSPGGSPGSAGCGFPVWAAAPPRPPYHPHMHRGAPSQLPPAFRGHMPPSFMTRRTSSVSIGDESSVTSGSKRAAPTVAKSILKKSKVEASASTASSEAGSITVAGDKGTDVASDKSEQINESNVNSVVVDKGSVTSTDAATKKQMIISPASSNEALKSEEEDNGGERALSPQQPNLSYDSGSVGSPNNPHAARPYRMGHHLPTAHGRHAGHPYMPPSPVYHHPGMHAYPMAGGAPGMYSPPRNMSARGRPRYPGMAPFYSRNATPSPAPSTPEQQQQLRDGRTFDKAPQLTTSAVSPVNSTKRQSPIRSLEGLSDVSGNSSRCIPLASPGTTQCRR